MCMPSDPVVDDTASGGFVAEGMVATEVEAVKATRSCEFHAMTIAGATRKFACTGEVCVALMTVTELYPVTLEHIWVDVLWMVIPLEFGQYVCTSIHD